MEDSNTGASAQPAKKKRSLFKEKKVPTQSPATEPTNHVDSFSRAKYLFAARLKEEQLEREKRAAKAERKRSSQSREKSGSARPEKKMKLSVKAEKVAVYSSDSDLDDEGESRARRQSTLSTPPNSRKSPSAYDTRRSPTSLMGQFSKNVQSQNKKNEVQEIESKGYISLTDSEDDSEGDAAPATEQPATKRAPTPPSANSITIPDDNEDPDEEFPELLQRARERRRLAELERSRAAAAFANQNHEPSFDGLDDVFRKDHIAPPDPTVNIFITSRVEGCQKPLQVKRKLSGRLLEVRHCWCDKQTLEGEPKWPEEIKDEIFLTWRGKRLFDAMSCESLGIKVDSEGNIENDGEGFVNGNLHMEAWTQGVWDSCLADYADEKDDDNDVEEVEEDKPKSVKVRLVFKANLKDIKDFKLAVKPTTTIRKIEETYRDKREIPANKKVIFDFDGDHLDVNTTVADADLGDMDTIDVYIK